MGTGAESKSEREHMDERWMRQLREAMGGPAKTAVTASRQKIGQWFAETAPAIRWDVIPSPLGPLYIAVSAQGLCSLDFGVNQGDFLNQLDPLARTMQGGAALMPIAGQLQAYFAGERSKFDFPLDLQRLTPFQVSVLQAARRIPAGTVWTYRQIAEAVGKPNASRAVGQALGRNPVPIVIPCHRVIASDGSLGGYSGGGGLESKKYLLTLEKAL
jgi:O-6-methylguanine DNA methyltransferase